MSNKKYGDKEVVESLDENNLTKNLESTTMEKIDDNKKDKLFNKKKHNTCVLEVKNKKSMNNKRDLELKPLRNTVSTFGKAKVIDDKIIVYETNICSGTIKERVLENGKTFYFDAIHTEGDKTYVSWNAVCGRNYTLLKDIKIGKSPIIKIG